MNRTKQLNTALELNTLGGRALCHVRNIGIAAHIDAGKTTLTERILFYTGEIHATGDVHHGNTTTDSGTSEKKHGITITAASVSCRWTPTEAQNLSHLFGNVETQLNIIDTPGHVDFTAEVERSLRVLDGTVVVLCGVAGVQPQTETVWRQADKYHVPRVVFINKMDRVGADFKSVADEVEAKFGIATHTLLIPVDSEKALSTQLDIINQKLYTYHEKEKYAIEEIPETLIPLAKHSRNELIEKLANLDETIAEQFLLEIPIETELIKQAIRRLTVSNQFVPIAGGSAFKNVGVQGLLDMIVDYLPSPEDGPAIETENIKTNEKINITTQSENFCGLVFKVCHDKFTGKLAFVRVYSGSLEKGQKVLNTRSGKSQRISRLLLVDADKFNDIETCQAGDIVAIVGLKETSTGDTICQPDMPLSLEPPSFPEPVVSMAIEPESSADQERLSTALHALVGEDPTLHLNYNEETAQTVLSGMGELHLEIAAERLTDDFKVNVRFGNPQIAYRETITRKAVGEFFLKKQEGGGSGAFAKVVLSAQPNERGTGITIDDKTTGGTIPKEFIGSCRKGITEACNQGALGGYPIVDIHFDLLDGKSHPNDSHDLAFKTAAMKAVQEALKDAGPELLEPIMQIECDAPAEYQGDLIGDINRRRGQVTRLDQATTGVLIQADVPLAELIGYAKTIRSIARGRASYCMQPDRMESVPASIAEKVIQK